MAFAIHLETESSDHYVYAFDGQPTSEEIVEKIKENLGDEFNYVSDWHHDATYPINFKMEIPDIDFDNEEEDDSLDEDDEWKDFDDEEE